MQDAKTSPVSSSLCSVNEEHAVVASLFRGEGAIEIALECDLEPKHFSCMDLGTVFDVAVDIYEQRQAVTETTVLQALRKSNRLDQAGGEDKVRELARSPFGTASLALRFSALEVRDLAVRRALIHVCQIHAEAASERVIPADEVVDKMSEDIMLVAERGVTAMEIADKRAACEIVVDGFGEQTPGLIGPWVDLNRIVPSIRPGQFVTVAARPAMGKSVFALNLARHFSGDRGGNIPVGYLSMEMDASELAERWAQTHSGLSLSSMAPDDMRFDKTSQDHMLRFSGGLADFNQAPLYINDRSGHTISSVRRLALRMKRKHKIGLLIVDYLQIMDYGRDDEVPALTKITKGMKNLARDLEIPVIALSQLNRDCEKRQVPRPQMSDLRGSGSVEQDSDILMFLYRQEYYDEQRGKETHPDDVGTAEVIVAKHRRGATGIAKLHFDRWRTQFRTLSQYDYC